MTENIPENATPVEPFVNEVGGETPPPPPPAANDKRMENTAGEIVEGGEMQVVSHEPIVTNEGTSSHHNLTGEEANPVAADDDAATAARSRNIAVASSAAENGEEPTQMRYISPVKPTICRMVEYRSRTGNYSVPAVITCTVDSIYQPGVEHGFMPPLSGVDNVHLTVFSPGIPGLRIDAANNEAVFENFVVQTSAKRKTPEGDWEPMPVSENVSGCYQEWDIPFDMGRGPGTWTWPERV